MMLLLSVTLDMARVQHIFSERKERGIPWRNERASGSTCLILAFLMFYFNPVTAYFSFEKDLARSRIRSYPK